MPGTRGTLLLVEDDEAMAVALRDGFQFEGFEVTTARDGAEALRHLDRICADLLVLDVMLPKISGFDVCRRVRERGGRVPIIMLTARGQEVDKVTGLRLGADDYVTKPFSFMELLARVEAVMRRAANGSSGPGRYCFGSVSVDFTRYEASRNGSAVDLSPREFDLLAYFVKHRGEVVTRAQLLDAVWGYSAIPVTRTVDAHVAKLRKKVEECPANPRYLLTVHRLGYKFVG